MPFLYIPDQAGDVQPASPPLCCLAVPFAVEVLVGALPSGLSHVAIVAIEVPGAPEGSRPPRHGIDPPVPEEPEWVGVVQGSIARVLVEIGAPVKPNGILPDKPAPGRIVVPRPVVRLLQAIASRVTTRTRLGSILNAAPARDIGRSECS
jgi:hypothetical protein